MSLPLTAANFSVSPYESGSVRAMLWMFDLDGTLTDPYDGITRSVAYAFDRLKRPVPAPELLREFIGPPLHDSFAKWLSPPEVEAAVGHYRTRFAETGWQENRVYEGIPELLADLGRRGDRLAVVTSKPTVFAERILVHFALHAHVERVVGATLDGRLRHKADLVRVTLADAEVPTTSAVMVGDRAQDITGAKANNVAAVGVAWGYSADGELEAAGADAIVLRPAQLLPFAARL